MNNKFILFLIPLLLLYACSTAQKGPRPAVMHEKTYGVASWYGADFHGRPTSSGEIFNMHAYTCAHRDYPFGTRLKVMHLSNNRSTECLVNDRGPFIAGRDIDLSYAVAKEIGVIGPGTSKVMMEVVGRDLTYIKTVKLQAKEGKGLFAIQVGAFTEDLNAARLKEALSLKYDNVYIEEAEIKGTIYHRVRIGIFKSFSSAWAVAETMGQEGYQTIIIKTDGRI